MHRMFKAILTASCCALAVIASTACGSQPAMDRGTGPAWQDRFSAEGGAAPLPEINRLTAAPPEEFIVRQNGADYAADLAHNRCIGDGVNLKFQPAWPAGGSHPLDDAAYCLYRLQLDPDTIPATLTLLWDGVEPQQVWLGLANWQTQHWTWEMMPVGGELTGIIPTPFTDQYERCYVAVVVLGETECDLKHIGFGEPTPPPPVGNGFTLFAPMSSYRTFLINEDGETVHEWSSEYLPGLAAYLTEDGHLLRQCNVRNEVVEQGGGSGGRLEEHDWDGNLVWSYDLSSPTQCTHHDFRLLPNGNILMIVWNVIDKDVLLALGRNPTMLSDSGLWLDSVIEVEPTYPSGGNVVWEWRVIDHLIQDFDPAQKCYGAVAAHPELIDINYNMDPFVADWSGVAAMDWNHTNAVYWNEEFDQLVLSIHSFSEIWVIDHSTTTAEAASHAGGHYGKGGDLLYRWGNPQTYKSGTEANRQLFLQHDAQWIPDGLAGAGNILIFNNQAGKPTDQNYSTVLEIAPPIDSDGNYRLEGSAYGPLLPSWVYRATPAQSFFSPFISSAQRLPDGNTLICCGGTGWLFEVDPDGEITWEYTNKVPYNRAMVFRARRYQEDYPGVAALLPPVSE